MTAPVKKLAIFLAVSVGLNLFLLGVFSARLFHRGAPPAPPPALFHAGEAPEPDRTRMMGALKEHRDELRAQWHKTRDARRHVHEALTKEPFDAAELERRLGELRQETVRSQEVLHEALVSAAKEASPRERRRLAAFAEGLPRLGPHGRGGEGRRLGPGRGLGLEARPAGEPGPGELGGPGEPAGPGGPGEPAGPEPAESPREGAGP